LRRHPPYNHSVSARATRHPQHRHSVRVCATPHNLLSVSHIKFKQGLWNCFWDTCITPFITLHKLDFIMNIICVKVSNIRQLLGKAPISDLNKIWNGLWDVCVSQN
jgi:hypothetical protein